LPKNAHSAPPNTLTGLGECGEGKRREGMEIEGKKRREGKNEGRERRGMEETQTKNMATAMD